MYPLNCELNDSSHYKVVEKFELGSLNESYYFLEFKTKYNEKVGYLLSKVNGSLVCGFYNSTPDTVVYNNRLHVFINPYPDVYIHTYCIDETLHPCPIGQKGYTTVRDSVFLSTCVKNDSIGTLVYFFENNCLHMEGHFSDNKKEGVWKIYNNSGRLVETEVYSDDVLIKKNRE